MGSICTDCPFALAPDEQTHIGAMIWLDDRFKIDKKALRNKSEFPFSHDNLFHTILGLLRVQTSLYDKNMDIISG